MPTGLGLVGKQTKTCHTRNCMKLHETRLINMVGVILNEDWLGLVDRKLVSAPSNFINGRAKAALLFWFFGDFRYGVLLFMVILVLYKYKNR